MQLNNKNITGIIITALVLVVPQSCKKLVAIDEPINSLTSKQVFTTEAQATSALAGVYTGMINGLDGFSNSAFSSFSNGLTTILTGLSSDELVNPSRPGAADYNFNYNRLQANETYCTVLWGSAYQAIYGANAVIEGLAASNAPTISEEFKKQLTGEAKFLRAFSYFYLINFFGDVPLVLSIDFNQTRLMARTPQQHIYEQIIKDLKEAQSVLPADYSNGNGERVRANRWAATALLARTYLYINDYANAASQATDVINQTALFDLPGNLDEVFLKNSMEAIWQLQQNTSINNIGTATPEGMTFLPMPLQTGSPHYYLTDELLSGFENNDRRRKSWIDSTDNSFTGQPGMYYFSYKYKTGPHNYVLGGEATEYYMVLRLAEMYLVRAEARANGAGGGPSAAIADLNLLRQRAGLTDLSNALTQAQVKTAVAHERQTELFAEWGHRWFDLKRTGQAHDVLSQITMKQPWTGDYQLLYPIPVKEIIADRNLIQNPGY